MVSACRSVRDCPWQMPPQRKPGEGAESEGMGLGRGESLVIYGPLVEIGPRVAGVMASGLLALAALRISGRAFCERGLGIVGFVWLHGSVLQASVFTAVQRRCAGRRIR